MLKCEQHPQETIAFACLAVNCTESSRLLCNDCAIFSPNHKDHLSHLVNIEQLLSSSDGSSLRFLCNSKAIGAEPKLGASCQNPQNQCFNLPFQLNKQQVNMYFDILHQRTCEELERVRNIVLSLCEIQQSLQANIDSQLLILEARISSFLEDYLNPSPPSNPTTAIPRNRSLSNLYKKDIFSSFSQNNNNNNILNITSASEDIKSSSSTNINNSNSNFNSSLNSSITLSNEISSEITSELLNFNESCSESITETTILTLQTLKTSALRLQQFESDLAAFLASGIIQLAPNNYSRELQHSQQQQLDSILSTKFSNEFEGQQRIQLLPPAEFYTNIGYTNCIAIHSLEDLPLLRQVSLQICSESEQLALHQAQTHPTKKQLLQNANIMTFSPAQRSFFFSILLDKKDLGDREAFAIAKQLERIRYVTNIHLDFDENDISDAGYSAIFQSLGEFVRLEHIDLRFNKNFQFGQKSISRFVELLEKHKSSLRVLCLTIRQLRATTTTTSKRENHSDSTSPLSSSSQSSSSSSHSLSHSLPHAQLPQRIYRQQSHEQQQQQQQQQQSPTYSVAETIEAILESISKLHNLEVLYLDFSNNNLISLGNRIESLCSSSEAFSKIFALPLISTVHIVLNQTFLPNEDAHAIVKNTMNSHPSPFKYLKLFLKENQYSFQQQRTISGQFQKIQAEIKNFDLFF